MEETNPDRLRPHPAARFDAPQHQFDLDAVAARLKHEPRAGEAGRRQQTLYKRGPVSVSLFVFDRLTRLAAHRAKGVVTIHVLAGRLQVTAESQTYDLRPGGLLVLAPGVEHDVAALDESHMLLTVNLEPPPSAPEA
jgi:quercetin dioxygenase-like cupin family protein